MSSNRKDLKEKTLKLKALEAEINGRKKEIDRLKDLLDKKRETQKAEGDATGDVIDEEEFAIIKELKEHKKSHKKSFDEYRGIKSEVMIIKQNIDQAKQKLVMSFDEWYDKTYGPYLSLAQSHTSFKQAGSPTAGDNMMGEQKEPETVEEEVDPEAIAYIKAKKKVDTIHKAKKVEKMKRTMK